MYKFCPLVLMLSVLSSQNIYSVFGQVRDCEVEFLLPHHNDHCRTNPIIRLYEFNEDDSVIKKDSLGNLTISLSGSVLFELEEISVGVNIDWTELKDSFVVQEVSWKQMDSNYPTFEDNIVEKINKTVDVDKIVYVSWKNSSQDIEAIQTALVTIKNSNNYYIIVLYRNLETGAKFNVTVTAGMNIMMLHEYTVEDSQKAIVILLEGNEIIAGDDEIKGDDETAGDCQVDFLLPHHDAHCGTNLTTPDKFEDGVVTLPLNNVDMTISLHGHVLFQLDDINVTVNIDWTKLSDSFVVEGVGWMELDPVTNDYGFGKYEENLLEKFNKTIDMDKIIYVSWRSISHEITTIQTVLVTLNSSSDVYVIVLYENVKLGGKFKVSITAGSASGSFEFCKSEREDIYIFHAYEGSLTLEPKGNVRIRDGYVEVNVMGEWGSVCSNSWGDRDANVLCKELRKLPYGANATRLMADKEAKYFMDGVRCRGCERSILQCRHRNRANLKCRRGRAGVECLEKGDITVYPRNGDGEVKIKIKDKVVSVCTNFWTNDDAKVACREIDPKYKSGRVYARPVKEDNMEEYSIDYVNCRGDEPSLLACLHTGIKSHGCKGPLRAYVKCIE